MTSSKQKINPLHIGLALVGVFAILLALLYFSGGKSGPDIENLDSLNITTGSLPALGSANAPVTIIEFSDYQCSYCAKLYSTVKKKIKADYINTGKVKLYFRDLPLPMHDKAKDMALATRCANEQGKFWEMHNKIFENQNKWAYSSLSDAMKIVDSYAAEFALDSTKFKSCMESKKYENEINEDVNYFIKNYKKASTPVMFILLPKNKTSDLSAVNTYKNAYPDNVLIGQNSDSYVVVIIGAFPYETYKAILNTVKY